MLHAKPFLDVLRLRAVDVQSHGTPYHHVGQFLRIRLAGGNVPDIFALTENRNTIGDLHNLMQFMRDNNN